MTGIPRRFRRSFSWVDGALGLWTVLVFTFLFAPIVTAVLYSFNEGLLGRQSDSFRGFTVHWYPAAWTNPALRHAVEVSLRVGAATAIVAAVLGTMSGLVLARHSGRLTRGTLEILVYLLLLVPEIVLAVSSLLLYSKAGIPLGQWSLVAAHSAFSIAVVALIVRARVLSIDRATEEASADLGAGGLRTFWDVTLPQIRPAILAGAILAFTFSFDNLVISVFLTTPTVTTLPVYLFGSVRGGLTPDVYAIASLMLGFTLFMLLLFGLVYRWQVRRLGGSVSFAAALTGQSRPTATSTTE